MKLLSEFLHKPRRVKIMLIKAMYYSLYYKAVIKRKPFAEYAEKMGEFKYETPFEEINPSLVKEVKWIAYAVNRWAPWKSLCFDQALMAKKLLNQNGLPCTLYMGVMRDSGGKLVAHAWLRCGRVYVSGGDGAGRGYAVTGIYGDRTVL